MLDFQKALQSGNLQIIREAKAQRQKRIEVKKLALRTCRNANFDKTIEQEKTTILEATKRLKRLQEITANRDEVCEGIEKDIRRLESEVVQLSSKLPAAKGSISEAKRLLDNSNVSGERLLEWIAALKGLDVDELRGRVDELK